jgi:hypothetical protein
MFDLSRKSTLNSVKEWYRQARGFNKVSIAKSAISVESSVISKRYYFLCTFCMIFTSN